VAKAVLAVSIVALGGTIVWVGSGGVGPFVAAVANGFGGIVDRLASAVESRPPTAPPVVSGAPAIVTPDDPYTNIEVIDVTVTIPQSVAGHDGYTVRLWATIKDSPRTLLTEVPVGPTSALIIPGVALSSGRNDLQASINGPAGESELSPVATWVLDQAKPKITVISPKNNTLVTKSSLSIKGKTQARSSIIVRNDANGATASAEADQDGLFQASIAIAAGSNAMTITATDPAGNANTQTLTVRKGAGKLLISLTGSVYQLRVSKLPRNVSFTVVVTGPDGQPVEGATALFTVTVPGLEAIVSSEIKTSASGSASFTTRIPKGAMAGAGLATVLVTTPRFGTATDRQVLTVR
jgi:hypothetical protein